MDELYHKYRPKLLKQVIGQSDAVRVLEGLLRGGKFPHATLLAGASGVGKTSLARILRTKLKCSDTDFCEMNCADDRGIDSIRSIGDRMRLAPLSGGSRIWILDECHKLSGDASSALLKILEDQPRHAYFFLCTTDPDKLLKTIITRCTVVRLSPLSTSDLTMLLQSVLEKEHLQVSADVIDKIVEASDGSARKALVLLHQVAGLGSDEGRLSAILKPELKRQSFDLVKAMLYEPKRGESNWPKVAEILRGLEGEDPEQVRRFVLACAATEALKAGRNAGRAYLVLDCFAGNFYDSGRPGLVRAAYEIAGPK